jgi:hypothetical protein
MYTVWVAAAQAIFEIFFVGGASALLCYLQGSPLHGGCTQCGVAAAQTIFGRCTADVHTVGGRSDSDIRDIPRGRGFCYLGEPPCTADVHRTQCVVEMSLALSGSCEVAVFVCWLLGNVGFLSWLLGWMGTISDPDLLDFFLSFDKPLSRVPPRTDISMDSRKMKSETAFYSTQSSNNRRPSLHPSSVSAARWKKKRQLKSSVVL